MLRLPLWVENTLKEAYAIDMSDDDTDGEDGDDDEGSKEDDEDNAEEAG